jgi:hypothetical protein
MARSEDHYLVAWTGADGNGTHGLFAMVLARDGAALGPPRVVATISTPVSFLGVRSASAAGGWVLIWSTILDKDEELCTLSLSADGAAAEGPTVVQRTSDHIEWATAVVTSRGALCVWVEESPADDHALLVASTDTRGRAHGVPLRIVRGITRWQAASAGDSVALAFVSGDVPGSRAPASVLSLQSLDALGNPTAPAVVIARGDRIDGDVDLTRVSETWALAWTDQSAGAPRMQLAFVDAVGDVVGPRNPLGQDPSTLLGFASAGAGAAVAWEEAPVLPHRRQVHLGTVFSEGGALRLQTAPSVLELASAGSVELVRAGSGLAAIGQAPSCGPEISFVGCSGAVVPTFVRFGPHLEVEQAEPLFVRPEDPATLAWNLVCGSDGGCATLAATSETPTPVVAFDLKSRRSPFPAPIALPAPRGAAHSDEVTTMASGPAYEGLSAASVGDQTILASIAASSGPAKNWRLQPASVYAHWIDGAGAGAGKSGTGATLLTSRASSFGSVALANGASPEDGAAVVWIARTLSGEQVHIAHLSTTGRRETETSLPVSRTGLSVASIAWAGDGWIVAWTDDDGTKAQLYATKLKTDLQRAHPIRRIARVGRGASDLALAASGDVAWLAWSDPRDSPREGVADIFATTLRTKDAARSGDEVRVLATTTHSRSPALAPLPDGTAIVAWIEEGLPGVEGHGTLMAACLDAGARLSCPARNLTLAGDGRPMSLALVSGEGDVRAVVARTARDGVTIDALRLGPAAAVLTPPWPVAVLDAPGSFETTVAAARSGVFFIDVGSSPAERRIRRVAVAWPR